MKRGLILLGALVIIFTAAAVNLASSVPVAAQTTERDCKSDEYFIPGRSGTSPTVARCAKKAQEPRNASDCPSGTTYKAGGVAGAATCAPSSASNCKSDEYFVPAGQGTQAARCVKRAESPRSAADCPANTTFKRTNGGTAGSSKTVCEPKPNSCDSDEYYVPSPGAATAARCVKKAESPRNASDCPSGTTYKAGNGTTRATCVANSTAATNNGDEENDDCDAKYYNPLTWVICPIVDGINTAVDQLDVAINNLLTVDTARIFDTSDTNGSGYAYMQAWNSFRVIGIAIIVISALIVIISSAFGFEILDAYTIRRTLPRLLIALVVITLSWNILYFLVGLSNDVGNGVRWIIYQPFSQMQDLELGQGSLMLSNLLLGAGITALGIMGLLSFGATALLAALLAFLVLIMRELIIIFLIIIAPIGIACMILPNTRKVWDIWQKTLTSMLVAFPIIAGIIAVGRVFSTTIYANGTASGLEEIIAFIAYLLPYFMLPFAFRLAGGLIATLGGLANDRSRGAFDRLKNYRGNKLQSNMQGLKEGNRIKSSNWAASRFNAATRGVASAPSAGMTPWKMRSRYQAGMYQHKNTAMAEYMEKSEAWKAVQGNDDYLQATMKNMGGGDTEDDWRRYLRTQGYTGRSLEQGVAAIRAAKRDTNDEVFKAAAVVANASTGTGWKQVVNKDETSSDYGKVIKGGGTGDMLESINEAAGGDRDLAARMLADMRGRAERSRRVDLAGSGFGTQIAALNNMHAEHLKLGGRRTEANKEEWQRVSDDARDKVLENALYIQAPNAFAGARGDAIKMFAPQMVHRLQEKHDAVTRATTPDAMAEAQRELTQEYAALAGRYDSLSHSSPENAKILADNVFGAKLGLADGSTVDVRKYMDDLRADPVFLQTRREYRSELGAGGGGGGPTGGGGGEE